MLLHTRSSKNSCNIDTQEESSLHSLLTAKDDVIASQQQRISFLEEALRLEKVRRFGPSSEQYAGQGELFNEAEQVAEDESASSPSLEDQTAAHKSRGRKGLSPSLPRHQVYLTLTEEEKVVEVDAVFFFLEVDTIFFQLLDLAGF